MAKAASRLSILFLDVGALESLQNFVEGLLDGAAAVDGVAVVGIFAGNGVAVGVKDVGVFEFVVGMIFDAENGEGRRAKVLAVDGESADGHAEAIGAEIVEADVLGLGHVGGIEEGGVAVVPIEIAALGLEFADVGEFAIGVDGLVDAGTEKDFGLVGEVLAQEQSERCRVAVLEGEEARGGASGGIEIGGVHVRRRFGAVGNFAVEIGGVVVNGQADLAKVGKADGFLSGLFGGGERGQQHAREDRDDRHDDEQFDQRERSAARCSRLHLMVAPPHGRNIHNYGSTPTVMKTFGEIEIAFSPSAGGRKVNGTEISPPVPVNVWN
jgi:hypothetical protein